MGLCKIQGADKFRWRVTVRSSVRLIAALYPVGEGVWLAARHTSVEVLPEAHWRGRVGKALRTVTA
jgi:hypothetical protein